MYQDYKDLLSAFQSHGVKYLVVGGFAVIRYSQPRFTKDMEFLGIIRLTYHSTECREPERDRPACHDSDETNVTSAMIDAGAAVLVGFSRYFFDESHWAELTYRAMERERRRLERLNEGNERSDHALE